LSSLGSLANTARSLGSYVTQGLDIAQTGVQGFQAAQQFAKSLGLGPQPSPGQQQAAPPAPPDVTQPAAVSGSPVDAGAGTPGAARVDTSAAAYTAGQPTAQPDQLALLLQALQQRQIPALPGSPTPSTPPAQFSPAPQTDALTLLRMILTNPQLQQTLQAPPPGMYGVPRTVELPIPATGAPRDTRSVQIPLGAVVNAIAALTGKAMTELNESSTEEEPEVPGYLVDDDGAFFVDPASADDRAALVAHLFRVSDATQRSGRFPQLRRPPVEADGELDESDAWARAAGFF
jgi:hypothetical protein